MEQLRAQLAERKRQVGARRGGGAQDPDVRRLEQAITARARPVVADEEEVAALAANEARYLALALEHYHRHATFPRACKFCDAVLLLELRPAAGSSHLHCLPLKHARARKLPMERR